MKTEVVLLLLLVISFTGVVADTNTSMSDDNINESIIASPTVSDIVPEEKNNPPGFEAVFAIAGLLAIAYLVVRQRED